MKLNCQPGDLAVVIRGEIPDNIGRVIRVTRSYRRDGTGRVYWEFEGSLVCGILGFACFAAADDVLRPLRDSPDDDETLAWCGTPVQRAIGVLA